MQQYVPDVHRSHAIGKRFRPAGVAFEFDLCDTAASAIIQGRAHMLLAKSSAAMFLRDEHHADPGQIPALCDRCNSANPFAGARCGETHVDQVS